MTKTTEQISEIDDKSVEARHTPEPWRYVDRSTPGDAEIGIRNFAIESAHREFDIASLIFNEFDIASLLFNEANARRIVAAVNACEGIRTEALENGVVKELLASSIKFSDALRANYSDAQLCLEERDAWRAAIEKGTGRAA